MTISRQEKSSGLVCGWIGMECWHQPEVDSYLSTLSMGSPQKVLVTTGSLLFIVKNQVFEVEVTPLTIIYKMHMNNFCFLSLSTLDLDVWKSQWPLWQCFFQAYDHGSNELTVSSPHHHFGLLVSLNQQAEKGITLLSGWSSLQGRIQVDITYCRQGVCWKLRGFSGSIC